MIQVIKSPRRAISLVEILIGVAVMGFALLPIAGYFTQLQGQSDTEDSDSEAISLASNIMENVLSPTLPFDQILCDGSGSPNVSSLTKAKDGACQAGVKDAQFEKLISDSIETFPDGEKTRAKVSRKGVKFKVYFFAGRYKDVTNQTGVSGKDYPAASPPNPLPLIPKANEELTFSYVPGPYGDRAASEFWRIDSTVASESNNKKILSCTKQLASANHHHPCPYLLGPMKRNSSTGAWENASFDDPWYYNDPQNYQRICGWPQVPKDNVTFPLKDAEHATALRTELAKLADRSGPAPTYAYHPITTDQGQFIVPKTGETGPVSALMKVVVGVKYRLHNFRSTTAGAASEREFWLASLKAGLEN